MTTFTTARHRDCFHPLSHHLLMVKLGVKERIVTLTSPDGLLLQASYVHMGTGAIVRNVQINLQGPVTLYFVASDKEQLSEWHYVCQWSNYFQRFGCSCYEGRHSGYCKHAGELEG